MNSQEPPDAGRWDQLDPWWDEVAAKLDAALAIEVGPDSITQLGTTYEAALRQYLENVEIAEHMSNEFMVYMQGFQGAAKAAAETISLMRDITFAFAVGVAVVAAAPAVAAAAGVVVAGAGLTGTTATVVATTGTGLVLGGIGAEFEGGVQGTAALVIESVGVLEDLMDESKTWEEALAGFDYGAIGYETWDGFKRGFVDGVMAYIGFGLEKYLVGSGQAVATRLFGQAAMATVTRSMLRSALMHSIAGGASGSVVGALDAGLKGAMAGKTMDEIVTDMQIGFATGLVLGGTLGAVGGAFEGSKPPVRSAPDAPAGSGTLDVAVSAYYERFPYAREAEETVSDFWRACGGQGGPPDIFVIENLGLPGITRKPPGMPWTIYVDAALDRLKLRETVIHEVWHTRVRQLYPMMGDAESQIFRNFIALDETVGYSLEVAARGRPQSWTELLEAIADIRTAPKRAAASLNYNDDPELTAYVAKRLLVFDKGRYVIVGAILATPAVIAAIVLDCYEFGKDLLGEDWQAGLDAALDQPGGG